MFFLRNPVCSVMAVFLMNVWVEERFFVISKSLESKVCSLVSYFCNFWLYMYICVA